MKNNKLRLSIKYSFCIPLEFSNALNLTWKYCNDPTFSDRKVSATVKTVRPGSDWSSSLLQEQALLWAVTGQNQQNECPTSEDSDQPWHPPSLMRVFSFRMKKAWVLSYPLSTQRRLWSDWADAQADPSLRWAHTHFVGFVMLRLTVCHSVAFCWHLLDISVY